MSLSSADLMSLDKGEELLDEVMKDSPNRRWVQAAIRDKFPLDQEDGHGRNVFSWASAKGLVTEMQAMIARDVECDKPDEKGQTPLILAADGGHFEAVQLLVDCNVPLDTRDKDDQTAAQRALGKGFNDVAAFLVSHGATPPPVDIDTELKSSVAVFARPLRMIRKS